MTVDEVSLAEYVDDGKSRTKRTLIDERDVLRYPDMAIDPSDWDAICRRLRGIRRTRHVPSMHAGYVCTCATCSGPPSVETQLELFGGQR